MSAVTSKLMSDLMSDHTLADFAFDLPPELIAQQPAPTRTGSRLLHVDGARFTDLGFADLPGLLRAGDLLVFNDTRVIKARVFARKRTGGKVELLVERIVATVGVATDGVATDGVATDGVATDGVATDGVAIDGAAPDEAWVQLRASHPPGIGGSLHLPGDANATVVACDGRFWRLRFAGTGPLAAWLERHGDVPLPPYIARRPEHDDATRYQTIYAREPGAVAAPTAGLHFDEAMLAALAARESALAAGEHHARGAWRAEFEQALLDDLPDTEIVGAGTERLWNTVSALMPEADCRQRWVVKLDKAGCAVSTGSACASGQEEPSHVLAAMGLTPAEAGRALRFSSGWETTREDWTRLLGGLRKVRDTMMKKA